MIFPNSREKERGEKKYKIKSKNQPKKQQQQRKIDWFRKSFHQQRVLCVRDDEKEIKPKKIRNIIKMQLKLLDESIR